MTSRLAAAVLVGLVSLTAVSGANAHDVQRSDYRTARMPQVRRAPESDFETARLETLWIFQADFEDLTGDNAGWFTLDRSGTLGQENYWHKDTIRLTEDYLGDSTWWCGTYDDCWVQARGYGNDWLQMMHRDFELASWSTSGDDVYLDFDQRFALEHDYDYGYLEISDDSGSTWMTIYTANNPGFAGKPGTSQDWSSANGHQRLSLGPWAGEDIRLRFRVESDEATSSQDEYDNPPMSSTLDGAWQLDNIAIEVNGPQVWLDDCESPGDNGWVHDDRVQSGNTGVVFFRGLFGTDFDTGRPFTCDNESGWMYAAVDPFTGKMIDNMDTWLISPPIDISGAEKLAARFSYWLDQPDIANDLHDLWLASSDDINCVQQTAGFVDEDPGGWYGGPYWGSWDDDWDAFAGNDWLAICYKQWNDGEAAPGSHMAGIFLYQQWVGIPTGDAGTAFTYGQWDRFNDWYQEELPQALLDTAKISVRDDDDVAQVTLMVTTDDGQTWAGYPCIHRNPESIDWYAAPPAAQMTPGTELKYYYEALDEVGNIDTWPKAAPDSTFEFSILPLSATVSDPGILLVDKHKREIPGEGRDFLLESQYYYEEALNILGYEWEVYDVEVESGSANSEGPDSAAYKYYDTIIWFSNDFDSYTFWPEDQQNVLNWLNQSSVGLERNFLVTGDDWCWELMEAGDETLDFVTQWLAVDYVQDEIGQVTIDSMPTIRDVAGGWTFMSGNALLAGGCPQLSHFDVIQPTSGTAGAEITTEYLKQDMSTLPGGVAYTHPTMGYQTVSLGFAPEFIVNSMQSNGHYVTGISERLDLMQNIMDYFGKSATTNPTDVPVDDTRRNALSHAHPNPFNPVTKIAYSVRDAGPVTIEIYNVAGRVVRTLLDTELDAGATGYVVWDGSTDSGTTCASGVYFYRMTAPGLSESRRVVMLK